MGNETSFDDALKDHRRATWLSGFFAGGAAFSMMTLAILAATMVIFH
jgi:hypothetical protein